MLTHKFPPNKKGQANPSASIHSSTNEDLYGAEEPVCETERSARVSGK